MCLNYSRVNQRLATDIYSLAKLEELVETVAGNEYYASLYIKDAYCEVLLDEEIRDLTTYSDGISLYIFKSLPFGLSCSAAGFFRQLAHV